MKDAFERYTRNISKLKNIKNICSGKYPTQKTGKTRKIAV